MLCLALGGSISRAADIPENIDYTASEYLDLGAPGAASILDDSDFLSFGDAPGTFLVTANTEYDFTGDQQLLFLDLPPVATDPSSASSDINPPSVPESGTFALTAAALIALAAGPHRGEARRQKNSPPL